MRAVLRGFESHPPHFSTNPPYPVLSELVSFGLWLQKQGYRNSTVQSNVKALKALAKRTDLLDSESVKEHLALAQLSEGRKQILAQYLERFYRFKGIAFEKTRYRRVERLPFVPTEVEIDQLISAVGRKMSAFLLLLKETGTRAGEAWNLKWTDVDSERNCVTVPPEKNSNPRQLKITARLFAALNNLPHVSAYIFRNPDIDASRSLVIFAATSVVRECDYSSVEQSLVQQPEEVPTSYYAHGSFHLLA